MSVGQQHLFQPTPDGGVAASKVLGGLDLVAPPAPSGAEAAAMAQPMLPGADASALAALPGANEISPLVQLIMRLPGASGLISSFFEFFNNFFMGSALDLFNPALFASHAAAAFSSTIEHLPMSLSLLPANAPILNGMASGLGQPMFSDMLSSKLNLSLGQSAAGVLPKEQIGMLGGNGLNASGGMDLGKPLYEGGASGASAGAAGAGADGGVLSGPGLTESSAGSHIANNTRLFSDKIGGSGFNTMSMATKTPVPTTTGVGSGVSSFGQTAGLGTNNSLANFGKNLFAPKMGLEGTSAVGRVSDGLQFNSTAANNAGFDTASAAGSGEPALDTGSGFDVGPSGAVSNRLGGSQDLLAMDQPSSSFRPTVGGPAESIGNGDITGLKAKQLSLDEMTPQSPGSHAQSAAHTPSAASHGTTSSAASHKMASAQTHSASHSSNSHSSNSHSASHSPKSEVHDNVHHRNTPKVQYDTPKHASTVNQVDTGAGGSTDAAAATDGTPSSYTVQSGDCLWNIAKQHFGDGLKWQDIYNANQNILGPNPDLIYPGTTIQLPGQMGDIANSGSTTLSHYTVQPGDNLWNISRDHLGAGRDWGQIYDLNKDVIGSNPSLIHPGQELNLPGGTDPAGGVASSAGQPMGAQGMQVDPATAPTTGADSMAGEAAPSADSTGSQLPSTKSMMGGEAQHTSTYDFSQDFTRQPTNLGQSPSVSFANDSPAQAFARGQEQALSNGAGFKPTLAIQAPPQGLPVLSPNQPMPPGPGAAQAAVPSTPAASGAVVSTSSIVADLQDFLAGSKSK